MMVDCLCAAHETFTPGCCHRCRRVRWPCRSRSRGLRPAFGRAGCLCSRSPSPSPTRDASPTPLTVPAGKTTFKIKNQQSRGPLEWEILDGVMVVEERENIIPGFVQTLTATLKPGQYQMTCGLLSNPKGMLTVTATGTSTAKADAERARSGGPAGRIQSLCRPGKSAISSSRPKRFTDAVKAGKLARGPEPLRTGAPAL